MAENVQRKEGLCPMLRSNKLCDGAGGRWCAESWGQSVCPWLTLCKLTALPLTIRSPLVSHLWPTKRQCMWCRRQWKTKLYVHARLFLCVCGIMAERDKLLTLFSGLIYCCSMEQNPFCVQPLFSHVFCHHFSAYCHHIQLLLDISTQRRWIRDLTVYLLYVSQSLGNVRYCYALKIVLV